ncbi:glycoside hydrolase family 127 protein [Peristeroidobacter agariperforans]|uniref:glycoside hydrolase family 127 protein n=1 Tax=Peristeroidobacter agariperforans TaxID=268404 RepID=UPI0018E55351|nr:beta-L-arabinofuranosidase domain-containing protein [Peristeroidobacter agariperforans]
MPNALMQFADPADVALGGVLGEALTANSLGRLSRFIVDEHSPAIALFHPKHREQNYEGDWYGEHAGKWLYAAARAAHRSGDRDLRENVLRVANFLVGVQTPEGYLGTYALERRFTRKQQPPLRTWDGAPSLRTWDIWTHSYLILGLLEVHKYFPDAKYVGAASRIGELCWRALTLGEIDITELGNHFGMSATVLLDPAVELYFATGDKLYLELATRIVEQAEARPELRLISQALAGADAAEIATGKAYQLCWNLVGLAKLHRATGDERYATVVTRLWHSIREHHLTLGGGPWGGVGHRSREVFNHPSVFSPHAYVETCSILAWLQLNRELLTITGEARYAEEIERTAYNDLLGAAAPDGEDWCYYQSPNGKRVHTTYWRCCKSSGAMALEELSAIAYAKHGQNLCVNLLGPGHATLTNEAAGRVRLEQVTNYPFDGRVRLRVDPERPASFSLRVRIPSWVGRVEATINGASIPGIGAGEFLTVNREWRSGDELILNVPLQPKIHQRASFSVQESRAPDGAPIAQEVMHYDYLALTHGPLVFATTLIDEFKSAETLLMQRDSLEQAVEVVNAQSGPELRLHSQGRKPLTFTPYFATGGRQDGAWRLTWMQVSWS